MANKVKVLTQKIPGIGVELTAFGMYANAFSERVRSYPGFIGSESFWGLNNHIWTISEWRSGNDWENWRTSSARQKVLDSYSLECKTEHVKLLKRCPSNDIFLL